jgi:hypothetical protein
MPQIRKSDYVASVILLIVTATVFWLSPVTQVTDSHYALLLSDNLIRNRSFTLDRYQITRHQPQVGHRDDYVANGPMWQIEIVDNHLFYYFPPGSSVLSVPFVAAAKWLGYSVVNPDGTYNEQAEILLQKALAAILMAICVVVLFFTARYFLSTKWSLLVALSTAFATQVWSTNSRALWSHTWETLLVSLLILLIVRPEITGQLMHAPLLGTIAAWLYFVRPNATVVIIAVTIYLLVKRRRALLPFLVAGIFWLVIFVGYSWRVFGTVIPSYYKPGRLRLDLLPVALAGNLISPSRGLLIYVPVVMFVMWLVLRFWGELKSRALAILATAVIAGHILLVSAFANRLGDWWGGASFGPRYLAELVPWFAFLAMLGLDAMLRAKARQSITLLVGVVLLGCSVFINARGALSEATWKWTQPINDRQMRALLWDWHHPQFLAGLQSPAPFVDVLPLRPGMKLFFSSRDIDGYLWYGWSSPEPGFRWTDGREAAIVFQLDQIRDLSLLMKAASFTVDGKLVSQKVPINLNGRALQTIDIPAGPPREMRIELPASALGLSNVLEFELPDAASPESFGLNEDRRLLGIQIEWLELIEETK